MLNRLKVIINNEKQWYVLRLTQEGALKWTTLLNTKFSRDNISIVTTIENISTDMEEIRNRDVVYHINATGKEIEAIRALVSDYMVSCQLLDH